MKIKSLRLKHTAELYALIEVSREGLSNMRWSRDATFESTARFITTKGTEHGIHYGVFHEKNLVGLIGIWQSGDKYTLGYWQGTPYRGHGLMTLAIKKFLTGQVWTRPFRVKIRKQNTKSLAVATHCGFKPLPENQQEHEDWVVLEWTQNK